MVIWMVVVPIEHRRDGISGAATKYRALHSRRRNGLLERGSTLCLAQHTSHQNLAYSQDSWQPQLMAIFTVTYPSLSILGKMRRMGAGLPDYRANCPTGGGAARISKCGRQRGGVESWKIMRKLSK